MLHCARKPRRREQSRNTRSPHDSISQGALAGADSRDLTVESLMHGLYVKKRHTPPLVSLLRLARSRVSEVHSQLSFPQGGNRGLRSPPPCSTVSGRWLQTTEPALRILVCLVLAAKPSAQTCDHASATKEVKTGR